MRKRTHFHVCLLPLPCQKEDQSHPPYCQALKKEWIQPIISLKHIYICLLNKRFALQNYFQQITFLQIYLLFRASLCFSLHLVFHTSPNLLNNCFPVCISTGISKNIILFQKLLSTIIYINIVSTCTCISRGTLVINKCCPLQQLCCFGFTTFYFLEQGPVLLCFSFYNIGAFSNT